MGPRRLRTWRRRKGRAGSRKQDWLRRKLRLVRQPLRVARCLERENVRNGNDRTSTAALGRSARKSEESGEKRRDIRLARKDGVQK